MEERATFVAMENSQALKKTLGTIIAAILTILGLPGLREDIATWATWLTWLRDTFLWWILLAAALVVFAVTWGPSVRRAFARRKDRLAKAAEADPLRQRLSEAEAEVARLRHETESLRSENAKGREALREAEAGRENASRQAAGYYQHATYGDELPEFYPLEEDDRREMMSRLHEFWPSLKECYAAAETVWVGLLDRAKEQGEESATYLLGERVHGREYVNMMGIMGGFRAALDNKWDARKYLTRAYACYREWRTWIVRYAALLGQPVGATTGYAKWKEADAKFFRDLQSKLALPQLEPVRRRLDGYDRDNGPTGELPPTSG